MQAAQPHDLHETTSPDIEIPTPKPAEENSKSKMSNPDTYQYRPLLFVHEIRLLLLQPGAPGSDIHCSLIHTTLQECHDNIYEKYTALSYVWGDTSRKRVIFIDRRPSQITINLATALDDLRHQHIILRLWADAICIDQSSIPERNHQVGLMRDIYSFAQHTIIYLGDSNDDCEQVMNAALQGPLSPRLRNCLALQILSRPWFTRVWIYQELVLSKDPWIQCGRRRIRWDVLFEAVVGQEDEKSQGSSENGSDAISEEEGKDKGIEVTDAMDKYEREDYESEDYESSDNYATSNEAVVMKRFSDMNASRTGQPQEPTLFSVMLNRRGFRATDLRDLVYGHLAVARLPSNINSPPCPVVDYRKSVVDVFTEATTYMLKKAQDYEVLLHTDICNPSCRLKGLPSWVPDWSLDSSQYLVPLPGLLDFLGLPGQIDDSPFSVPRSPVVHGNICTIRCLKIDTVKAISNIIPHMHSTPQLRSKLFEEMKRYDISPRQHFLSPLLLSAYCDAHQTLERMLGGNFLGTLPKPREDLFHQEKYQRLWGKIFLEFSVSNTIEDILFIHAIGYSQRTLINRKIGVLARGSLAILAPATLPGDEVHAFYSSSLSKLNTNIHLLVLRPQLNKSGIDAGNPEYETKQDDGEGWENTRHFTLIGCAWIKIGDPFWLYDRGSEWWDRRTTAWIH